ncbi:MAG: tetratricopeptide repeat protein [Nannocystaceae bacterium]|nr:tetratricopeptide repeat protein [bacterium]
MTCPDENALDAFALGELQAGERAQMEAHLDQCPMCSEVVAELTKIFAGSLGEGVDEPLQSASALDSTEHGATDPEERSTELPLPQGAKLGRYVVLKAVGAGAMGVVYAAYDPQLDRKVALKVLRRGAEASPDDSQASRNTRMLREAQALARLSHPSVITVHDVGSFEGQVFLAMEFVEGGTLAEWLRAEPRPWRLVRNVFLQAGEGLAAAHEAGLVHRDFKPDNVLMHADGRAVVTDFGLARRMLTAPDVEAASPPADTQRSGSRSPLAVTLTQTGALVGTPAYMAPEQLGGERSNALADQFGFCVALYEGLYGERPFRANTLMELVTAVSTGRVPPAPRGSEVPRWLRRAVLRGLSVDPQERHPDMRALLAALRPKALSTRRAVAAIGVLGVTAGGLAVAVSERAFTQPVAYCDDVAAKLDGVWDEPRRAAVASAFLDTEQPFAPDAVQRVAAALDAYAERWVHVQTDACRAEVEGREPPAVVAARMTCLSRRHATLATMTEELARANADTVMRAPQAVASLPDLGPCLDAAAPGRALSPVPEDEVDAVAAVRKTLDEASVQRVLGRMEEDLAMAEAAVLQAKALAYAPARAEARLSLAEAQLLAGRFEDAEAGLHEALSLGIASHHGQIVAQAAAELGELEAKRLGPQQTTLRWVALGLAALEAQGGQWPDTRANLLNTRSLAKRREGDLDGAIEDGQRVLKIREEHWGAEHYVTAEPLSELGKAYARKGDHAESIRLLDRAREVLREAYGDQHPQYAGILQNIATTHFVHGHYTDALVLYRESHQLLGKALGPEHPSVAVLAYNIGTTLLFMERYDEALVHVQRAREIEEPIHGPRSSAVATSWALTGEIHQRAGRFEEAEAALRTTLSILDEATPNDRRGRANIESQLGHVLLRSGRLDQARRELEAALAVQRETAGEPSVEVAETQGRLALVYLAQGELPLAQKAIDASVEQYESEDPDPHQHAQARFRRARILLAAGERAAARTEAERAREIYAERADQPSRLQAVERWLAQ